MSKLHLFKQPDFEKVNDEKVNIDGLITQLRMRAEQAELNQQYDRWEMAGEIKAAKLAFREYGRLIEKNNNLIQENKKLKKELFKKESRINKLNDFISRLLYWKKKKIKQLKFDLEKKYKSA
jgi:hypothetical protein